MTLLSFDFTKRLDALVDTFILIVVLILNQDISVKTMFDSGASDNSRIGLIPVLTGLQRLVYLMRLSLRRANASGCNVYEDWAAPGGFPPLTLDQMRALDTV